MRPLMWRADSRLGFMSTFVHGLDHAHLRLVQSVSEVCDLRFLLSDGSLSIFYRAHEVIRNKDHQRVVSRFPQ